MPMTEAFRLPECELLWQMAYDKAQNPDFVAQINREHAAQMSPQERLAALDNFFKGFQ